MTNAEQQRPASLGHSSSSLARRRARRAALNRPAQRRNLVRMFPRRLRIGASAAVVFAAAGCASLPVGDVPNDAARIPERVRTVAVPGFVVTAGDRAWSARAASLLLEQLRRLPATAGRREFVDPAGVPGRAPPPPVRTLEDALAAAAAVDADAVIFGRVDVAVVARPTGTAAAVVWTATLIDVRTREVYAELRAAMDHDPSQAEPPPPRSEPEPFAKGGRAGGRPLIRPPTHPRTADELVAAAAAEFAAGLAGPHRTEAVRLARVDDSLYGREADERLEEGRPHAAAAAWRAGLRLRPHDAALLYNLGAAAEHAGAVDEARAYYEAAVAAAGDEPLYRQARDRAAARLR